MMYIILPPPVIPQKQFCNWHKKASSWHKKGLKFTFPSFYFNILTTTANNLID